MLGAGVADATNGTPWAAPAKSPGCHRVATRLTRRDGAGGTATAVARGAGSRAADRGNPVVHPRDGGGSDGSVESTGTQSPGPLQLDSKEPPMSHHTAPAMVPDAAHGPPATVTVTTASRPLTRTAHTTRTTEPAMPRPGAPGPSSP